MPTRPTMADMHIIGPLDNVSIAYRNQNYIAEQVFPNVPVSKQTDKYYIFDKLSWFQNTAGPRAPRTRAPEGGYTLSSAQYTTIPISFAALVADEEEMNADDPLMPRRTAVEFATDKILLAKEKKVADLVFDNGSWAASATPSTTWDDASSDPISDIEVGKETLVKAIGREPNVCVMGREVWTDLRRHPDLLDLYKYTSRGMISMAQFQELFEIPKVLVGTAIVSTNQDGSQDPSGGTLVATTATYSFIWPNNMWLGWVAPNASLWTPSAGYVFTWRQRSVKTFRREEEETTVYRAEENFDEKVTASDAGYEFINCVA